MTYVGPYSQATLIYEPNEMGNNIEVATPGTILDYVGRNMPKFLFLIKKANLLPLYNSQENQEKLTLFLPRSFKPFSQYIDPNIAFKICKFSTTPGIVTTKMLSSSPSFVVYSLLPAQNLNIQSNPDGIKIQNRFLLAGDILCTNGIIHIIDDILYPHT
jgi:hypothetical protein